MRVAGGGADMAREAVADTIEAGREAAQFLSFTAGATSYGFPVERVREVVAYAAVLPIPRAPEHVHGVINLRGEVLPVIDLSCVLYGHRTPVTESTGIMFVETGFRGETVVVGAMIDSVEAVIAIAANDIDDAPAFGHRINPDFISGIGAIDGRFVVLLDVDRVLDVEALSRFGSAETA